MKEAIFNLMKGGILGVAMIIPGVSGGTMALVMGIYERLILAVNRITPGSIKEFLPPYPEGPAAKWKAAFIRLDTFFLIALGLGAVIVIKALSKLMPFLMEHHHEPTFGFFLGLILASVIIPVKMIKVITWKVVVAILIGTAAAGLLGYRDSQRRHEQIIERQQSVITQVASTESAKATNSPTRLFYIFISMAVAMSACILPGVSGSLVLVIFGVYAEILESISRLKQLLPADLLVIGVAMAGALVGIITFARLMKFALKRFHDVTMGCLIGLMIGSLYVIWPFRESGTIISRGKEKIAFGFPHMPKMGTTLWLTVAAAITGIAIIVVMEMLDRKKKSP